MTHEGLLQRQIMVALSERGHIVHRAEVGTYYSKDGRAVKIGTVGHSDLYGHRNPDGKMYYIECKTATGRVRPEQFKFIEAMRTTGALAGIARSVEDALKIVETDGNTYESDQTLH